MDLRLLLRFETRELVYFVALAEELHFARAARRVGINQSPLSRAITLMEYRLRVRLFHRTRQRTVLTPAGAALLPLVHAVLHNIDRVRQDIGAFAAGRKGRLRIGLCNGLATTRIAKLLQQSAQDDPQVEFSIEHLGLAEQLRELRRDEIDVGLAPSLEVDPVGSDLELSSLALRKDSTVLAMKPDHVLADQGVVRSLEAVTGPYIVIGDPSIGPGEVGALIEPSTAARTAIHYVPSLDALLTAVLAGHGVGLLAADQAQMQIGGELVFRPLGLSRARVTTHLIRRREDKSPVLSRFIERAQTIV